MMKMKEKKIERITGWQWEEKRERKGKRGDLKQRKRDKKKSSKPFYKDIVKIMEQKYLENFMRKGKKWK